MTFKILDLDKFKLIVSESISISECLKKMNLRPNGGNYITFKQRCKENLIDTSHFLGQGHLRNKQHSYNACSVKREYEDILIENSTYLSTFKLKRRLIKDNLLINKCALCGLENEWNGLPISLQLDHKNGIRTDNRLENLRLLCPNCHSQTSTFAGKNKTNNNINCKIINFKRTGLRKRKENFCVKCQVKIQNKSRMCKKCYNQHRKGHG